MRTLRALIVLALLGSASLLPAQVSSSRPATATAAAQQPLDLARYQAEIDAFVRWDRKNSFPRDAVLFTGSSSIAGWSTASAFPDLPVINRGFGGAQIAEVLHYFEQVVTPYRARVIVLYVGDNDVAQGVSPEKVVAGFREFVTRARAVRPDTAIVFLSVKKSAARLEFWPLAEQVNAAIREICRADQRLRFIDVATELLDAQDAPRDELFQADRLHLKPEGYARWTSRLRPVIDELLR